MGYQYESLLLVCLIGFLDYPLILYVDDSYILSAHQIHIEIMHFRIYNERLEALVQTQSLYNDFL